MCSTCTGCACVIAPCHRSSGAGLAWGGVPSGSEMLARLMAWHCLWRLLSGHHAARPIHSTCARTNFARFAHEYASVRSSVPLAIACSQLMARSAAGAERVQFGHSGLPAAKVQSSARPGISDVYKSVCWVCVP